MTWVKTRTYVMTWMKTRTNVLTWVKTRTNVITWLNKKLCLRNTIDAPSRQNQSHKVKGHSQGHQVKYFGAHGKVLSQGIYM